MVDGNMMSFFLQSMCKRSTKVRGVEIQWGKTRKTTFVCLKVWHHSEYPGMSDFTLSYTTSYIFLHSLFHIILHYCLPIFTLSPVLNMLWMTILLILYNILICTTVEKQKKESKFMLVCRLYVCRLYTHMWWVGLSPPSCRCGHTP